jgi:glycosyltransferase involved in cell wall biosynthesis
MDKLPLSLCVITLNEEANIGRCLASVPFASDVVVLDSGSQDATRTLAEEMGARVFNEPWRGFGPQKRRSVDLARYDWVICLDADEQLSPELQLEIYELLKSSVPPHPGYRIPRRSFHLGRWIYNGGWYPDFQTRLFSKKLLQWSNDELHESVKGANLGFLKADLNHYPFLDLAAQVQTNNRYSSLGAETLQKTGKRYLLGHLIIKPLVKFIELYLIKRGFRDGIAGYIIAIGGAYSVFLKYAKLWEMQHQSID